MNDRTDAGVPAIAALRRGILRDGSPRQLTLRRQLP